MNSTETIDLSLINIKLICRTCLKEATKGIHIFDMESKTQKSFVEMLEALTTIKIQLKDELPQKICNNCKNLIINSYNFINQTEHNEKLLWNYLLNRYKNDGQDENSQDVQRLENSSDNSNDSISQTKFEPTLEIYIKEEISDNCMEIDSEQIEDVNLELEKTKHSKNRKSFLKDKLQKESENDKELQIIDVNDKKLNIEHSDKDKQIDKITNDEFITHSLESSNIEDLKNECTICKKKFLKPFLLRKHMVKHEPNKKKYKCNMCGKLFTQQDNMKTHMKRFHNKSVSDVDEILEVHNDESINNSIKSKIDLVCKICNKSFVKQYLLKRHMVKHEPDNKKFECNICHKFFTQLCNMKTHKRKFHDEFYVPKPVTHDSKQLCTYCGKRVTHILVHLRRHTGEKPFKCDVCERAFASASEMKQHRWTHSVEKPFLCTECGKSFPDKTKFKYHQRMHTGDRPHKCTYCEQAFIFSKDLKHHIRRHTGEKPFGCSDCGKRFIQKTALRTHCKSQGHYFHEVVKEGLLIRPLKSS